MSNNKAVARSIANLANSGSTPRSKRCDESVCKPYSRARPAIAKGLKNAASKNKWVVWSLTLDACPPIIPASANGDV